MTPYYQDEAVTIYHGDCRDFLANLEADCVITDPPYGVELTGKRSKQRGGGVNVRTGTYGFSDTPEYVQTVVVPVIETCRRKVKAVVLTPGVRNLWAYPPADDLGGFYSASGTGMSKWGFTCLQPILYYGSDPYLRTGQGSRANSFGQSYPNDANENDHPCAKPIRMMQWLVNRASLHGETVLDPFMGSGTTLRAAKSYNRKAIGIELEEKYCEVAARRMCQEVLAI